MKPRSKRLIILLVAMMLLGGAAMLILTGLNEGATFYYTPSEVAAGKAPVNKTFRVGGMVEVGSFQRERDGVTVHFAITDTGKTIPVTYKGILPDLFKENSGAVVQGRLETDGGFTATEVLAKHDENYMPVEAKDAIERAHEAERTLQ